MIIDRIFSLVNKRTLSATIAGKVANASQIKHQGYVFDKIESGKFVVVPMDGIFSVFYIVVFHFQVQQVDGTCKLISKLRLLQVIFIDFILSLLILVGAIQLFSGAFQSSLMVLIMIAMLCSFLIIQMLAFQFLAFNEIESALRRADFTFPE